MAVATYPRSEQNIFYPKFWGPCARQPVQPQTAPPDDIMVIK